MERVDGCLPDQQWGDVFLVIDSWGPFKDEYELLEPVVTDLASRGLGFGIHFILTSGRRPHARPVERDMRARTARDNCTGG